MSVPSDVLGAPALSLTSGPPAGSSPSSMKCLISPLGAHGRGRQVSAGCALQSQRVGTRLGTPEFLGWGTDSVLCPAGVSCPGLVAERLWTPRASSQDDVCSHVAFLLLPPGNRILKELLVPWTPSPLIPALHRLPAQLLPRWLP